MDSLTFLNPGLIDPKCITTIGVSVKDSKNPIGYFGTGLKYAIAIILRNGGSITVWRGREPLRFEARDVMVRGVPASIVHMNDQELAFTTHLGATWEPWQAFRELWCNAKDEGGSTVEGLVEPKEGWTTIQVTSRGVMEAFRSVDKYIIREGATPLYHSPEADFYEGPSPALFYRGINVGTASPGNLPWRFRPNLFRGVTLTEDRTVRDYYQAYVPIAQSLILCEDPDFIKRWLTTGDGYAEWHINLDVWSNGAPSEVFLDTAMEVIKDTGLSLRPDLLKLYVKHRRAPDLVPANLLPHEKGELAKGVTLCRDLGYPVDDYPIIVMESLGESILGRADDRSRSILISKRALNMGDATLAGTLLEEWAHLRHNYTDCSRPFQNWLVDQIIRLGKAYLSKP